MSKIKPCPFCGEPAKIKSMPHGGYRCVCDTIACASRTSYLTKEMAIKEWNTRIRPKKKEANNAGNNNSDN